MDVTGVREIEAGTSEAFHFRIGNFCLEQGSLSFDETGTPLSLSLSQLKASIGYDEQRKLHKAAFSAGPGSFSIRQGRTGLSGLELKASFDREKIQLEDFLLRTESSSLSLSGVIEHYAENPRINFKTEGRLNLPELDRLQELGRKYEGELSWELRASGDPSWPQLSGSLTGPELEVYGLGPISLTLEVTSGQSLATVLNGLVKVDGGQVELTASIPPALKGDLESSLVIDNLNLRLLSVLLPDFPVELASMINGRLEVKTAELLAEAARGRAEFRLKPLAAEESKKVRPRFPLAGTIALTYTEGLMSLTRLNLKLLNSQLEVRGRLESWQKISGQLRWRLDNLGEIIQTLQTSGLELSAPGLKEQLLALESLDGSIRLESDFSGELSRPGFNLVMTGQNLAFRGVNLPLLEIKARCDIKNLEVSRFLARFGRGQVQGAGTFRQLSSDQNSVFKLDGRLEISGLELSQFASLVVQENRNYLNGQLSGSLGFAGTSVHPRSSFELSLVGTEIGTLKLEKL